MHLAYCTKNKKKNSHTLRLAFWGIKLFVGY